MNPSKICFYFILFFSITGNTEICEEITFSGGDHELLADHNNDMQETCKAAQGGAIWKACVACQADARRTDVCYTTSVNADPQPRREACAAEARAKSFSCPGKSRYLVHCEKNEIPTFQ